jgi:hypothetical protein
MEGHGCGHPLRASVVESDLAYFDLTNRANESYQVDRSCFETNTEPAIWYDVRVPGETCLEVSVSGVMANINISEGDCDATRTCLSRDDFMTQAENSSTAPRTFHVSIELDEESTGRYDITFMRRESCTD